MASVTVWFRRGSHIASQKRTFSHDGTAIANFFTKLEQKRSTDAQGKGHIVQIDLTVGGD